MPPFPDRVFLGQIGILTVAVLLWTVAKLDFLQTCGLRSNSGVSFVQWSCWWNKILETSSVKGRAHPLWRSGRVEDYPRAATVPPAGVTVSEAATIPSDTLTYEASRWCNCEPLSLSVSHRGTFRRGGSISSSEFTSTEEKLLQSLTPFVWRLPRILQVL